MNILIEILRYAVGITLLIYQLYLISGYLYIGYRDMRYGTRYENLAFFKRIYADLSEIFIFWLPNLIKERKERKQSTAV